MCSRGFVRPSTIKHVSSPTFIYYLRVAAFLPVFFSSNFPNYNGGNLRSLPSALTQQEDPASGEGRDQLPRNVLPTIDMSRVAEEEPENGLPLPEAERHRYQLLHQE